MLQNGHKKSSALEMVNKWWYRLQLPNPQFLYILCTAQQPKSDLGRLVVEISRLDTIRYTIPGKTPLNECSVRRRGRYLYSTKQTQETKLHALSGVWTSDPSNRAATYPLFRRHGHRDWADCTLQCQMTMVHTFVYS